MLPDKYHFIAVLEYGESGTIGVYFPDLPGCVSAADTTEKAIENAKEALSLHLYGMEKDGEDIPAPSELTKIKHDKGEIPIMIEVSMKSFRKKMLTLLQGATVSNDIPNAETLEAFEEIENGGGTRFTGTTEDLFTKLLED